jgi:6-phosphogluconolactonase (cycloisomerase 2 family)
MQGLPGITKLLVTVLALAAALANATPHGYVGVLRDDVGGVSLAGPHGLAITSDGAHVYVAAQVGAIAIFSPDPLTGALGFVGELADGNLLAGVYDLAVSADGAHVYAAVLGVGGGVRIYSRDAGTGLLTSAGTIGSFDAFAIAISPDDEHVYVCDRTGDSLVAYDRNTTTGALTFVEGETDGVGGVDGLDGARDVVVSPDGDHVYATGFNDDAVAVFSRDGTTGALTFVEVEKDGVGGVDGLDIAHAVAVSPDGAHVYVGGEPGVTAFSRDGTTGALTFVEYENPGLQAGAPRGIAVSPDGTHVSVAANGGSLIGALVTFGRDSSTGAVTLEQVFTQGTGGVDGVERAWGIAASPDGEYVYVTGELSTLATFRHTDIACSAAPATGCFQPTLPGKAKLLVKDLPGVEPRLIWKWTRGEAVTLGDLGDPVTTLTDYALCVYDGTASGPVVEAVAQAGGGCGKVAEGGATPCWNLKTQELLPVGYAYRSKTRSPHGVAALKVLAGAAGAAKASARARGVNLPVPALPLTLPVTVQLQNGTGECWEAEYSAAIANDGMLFEAISD